MTSMGGMTATTATLTDFLLARIAELEGVLERTTSDEDGLLWLGHKGPKIGLGRRRLLAECEAKRRIVDMHGDSIGCRSCSGRVYDGHGPCDTLMALALPYADHPEHRQEWKP